MSELFPLYTTDYISGVMSLRKPQTAFSENFGGDRHFGQSPQGHESESSIGQRPRYVSHLL